MISNGSVVPGHVTPAEIYCGVTLIVAVTSCAVLFIAEKLGTFPVPLATKPIAGFELVHAKAFAVPAKEMALVKLPPQILTLLKLVTVGT